MYEAQRAGPLMRGLGIPPDEWGRCHNSVEYVVDRLGRHWSIEAAPGDVRQWALLALWKGYGRGLRGPGLTTYIFRRCIDELRRLTHGRAGSRPLFTSLDRVVDADSYRGLAEAIAIEPKEVEVDPETLIKGHPEYVLLSLWNDGFSNVEIARQYGVTPARISQRVHGALKEIRDSVL